MKKWLCIFLILASVKCREAYNPKPATNGDGALVVEGVLNANGITTISLSRTTRLSDKRIAPEIGAFLFIEDENSGASFPLQEKSGGLYQSEDLIFDAAEKYRLRITTYDNRQYATAFKDVITTPVIDSLSWQQTGSGVEIFTHAHDDLNSTRFYKLDYEEDWEFHSAYRATLYFREVPPDPAGNRFVLDYLVPSTQSVDLRLFICYNKRNSSNINIVSTDKLGSNVLYAPVRNIPHASIELSVLYSINVKQYALSEEAYEFYSRMKKNTESLGSIFDAQPSELSGNVTCTTDPGELVIGYVECTTVQTKRLFINNDQLADWGYDLGCPVYVEPNPKFSEYPYPNDPALFENIYARGLVPTTVAESGPFGEIKKFFVNTVRCVDCRQRGTNNKPDFWP